MRKFNLRLFIFFSIYLINLSTLNALVTDKIAVKNSMQVTYLKNPKTVDNLLDIFTEGQLFGRLRTNYLNYNYENENTAKTADNSAWAYGGSIVYKTASFHGLSAGAGYYSSHTINTDNLHFKQDGSTYDAGKVPRNVYDKDSGTGDAIDVLAVSYLEYQFAKTTIKVGRQIFESAIVNSNDVYMIPNTFEGYSIESKDIPDTRLRFAYFNQEKLMGHSDFHSVIAFNGAKENDDGAAHKGLTTHNLNFYGRDVNPALLLFSTENSSVEGLKLNFDALYIDDYIASVIPEVNYKIKLTDRWSLTPGMRYYRQFDKNAGDIGGAALSGAFAVDKSPSAQALASYKDPGNLDAAAWMGRVVVSDGVLTLSAGYSDISDKADLVSPWRAFPTAGYTRDLTEFNWYANTQSYMLRANYNFSKANIIDGLFIQVDYAKMNVDDEKVKAKTITTTDRHIFHIDMIQAVKAVDGLELRMRLTFVNANNKPGEYKDYNSYNDLRFELDYFF